jgi:hypothetical protein
MTARLQFALPGTAARPDQVLQFLDGTLGAQRRVATAALGAGNGAYR